jgi:DNA-binding NarL/FixJ family response regulator
MKKELSSMQIFSDFVSKTILNDNEIEVLKRYIKGETIVKIADETSQSTATVSRTISELKEKYDKYKGLELAKLILFQVNE